MLSSVIFFISEVILFSNLFILISSKFLPVGLFGDSIVLIIYFVPCYYFWKACRVYVRILVVNTFGYVHETKIGRKFVYCIYVSTYLSFLLLPLSFHLCPATW